MKIQWAKNDDLDPACFYIIGQLISKEQIIVAGPYASFDEAVNERHTFTNHPDYSETMVLRGDFCKGLRTWEDLS